MSGHSPGTPAGARPFWTRRLVLPPLPLRDLLGVAALAALVATLTWPALVGGRSYYLRDLHLQWFGQTESFVRAVREGAWPLWDPYVGFGQPMLANANTQVLYPPTWLNLLVAPGRFYGLFFAAHLLWGGVGVMALVRCLGGSRPAATFGAAFWIAAGPTLSLGCLWNHLAAASWLPWILWTSEHACAEAHDAGLFALSSRRWVVGLAVALALPILAGSPEVAVMGVALVLGNLARHLVRARCLDAGAFHAAGSVALAGLLGLALAAAQLMPSVELLSRSARPILSRASRLYWSAPPAVLAQSVLPISWNHVPLTPAERDALFEGREPYLASLYLGLPVLVLAAVAALKRRPMAGLLGVMSLGATLLALGRHAPFYDVAVALIPPLAVLRFPVKAMIVTSVAASVLAALGLDVWSGGGRGTPRRGWGLALLLVAAAFGALCLSSPARLGAAGWRGLDAVAPGLWRAAVTAAGLALAGALTTLVKPAARWAALAVGILAVADLVSLHTELNPTIPPALLSARPELLGRIQQQDGQRLYVFDYFASPGRSERLLGRHWPYSPARAPWRNAPWASAVAMRLALAPPVAASWGVFDSYELDRLGIEPLPQARLVALLVGLEADGDPAAAARLRLLRLAAVSQVIALHETGFERLEPEQAWEGPFPEAVRVFHVPGTLPRVHAVTGVRTAQGSDELRALIDPSFNPATEVLLESRSELHETPPRIAGSVHLVRFASDRLSVECTLSQPGYVVLADTYDPGWQATIDARPATVLRANVAFRAVAVPAGRHLLEMRYRPGVASAGLAVSLAAALVAGVLMAWPRRTAARPAQP